MKTHDIPPETLNENIEFCINQYVRLIEHREILREKWFVGLSIGEIAARHHLSETAVKNVIYDTGDQILLRASNIKKIIIIED